MRGYLLCVPTQSAEEGPQHRPLAFGSGAFGIFTPAGAYSYLSNSLQVVGLRQLYALGGMLNEDPTLSEAIFLPIPPLKTTLNLLKYCLPSRMLVTSGKDEVVDMS